MRVCYSNGRISIAKWLCELSGIDFDYKYLMFNNHTVLNYIDKKIINKNKKKLYKLYFYKGNLSVLKWLDNNFDCSECLNYHDYITYINTRLDIIEYLYSVIPDKLKKKCFYLAINIKKYNKKYIDLIDKILTGESSFYYLNTFKNKKIKEYFVNRYFSIINYLMRNNYIEFIIYKLKILDYII